MPSRIELPLLLDTHCWLWLADAVRGKFSPASRRLIQGALRGPGLWISVISVWEVGLLVAKGRLGLSEPIDAWMARALDFPGLRCCDMTAEIALESTRLPDLAHPDPADRFIVATARVNNMALMTKDRVLLEYARLGHLRVMAP